MKDGTKRTGFAVCDDDKIYSLYYLFRVLVPGCAVWSYICFFQSRKVRL